MTLPKKPDPEVIDDPPPFLGKWSRVYAAVVVYLVLLILSFYLFKVAATS